MKTRLFATLSLAAALSGCTTLQTTRVCDTSLRTAATAQELIGILVRDWVLAPEKAASWASLIFAGQSSVATFCALSQPVPAVAGVGQ